MILAQLKENVYLALLTNLRNSAYLRVGYNCNKNTKLMKQCGLYLLQLFSSYWQ